MENPVADSSVPSDPVNTLAALQEEWKRDGYFHSYTPEWQQRLSEIQTNEYNRLAEKDPQKLEGRLKDGELQFGDEDDDDDTPTEIDPDLKEGKVVPKSYGKCPHELWGRPLAEIDPYLVLQKKTFIVVNQRFKQPYISRFSASRALFMMGPLNPLRRFAVFVSTNQFFDYFMILAIAANCILLALDNQVDNAEYFFLAVYIVEAFLKIVSRGFIINSHTYLRDGWNWLDFLILVTSIVFVFLEVLNVSTQNFKVSVFRTFRVFRALRTISIVPSLRTIVNALLKSFRMLVEVMGLTFFCMTLFSLFCIQVYRGILHQKCVASYDPSNNISYNTWVNNPTNWELDANNQVMVCGNSSTAGICSNDSSYICLDVGPNPNYGYTQFDSYGWAMVNSLQLITLDYWEQIYNKIIRASGTWNVIFFILVVFFGSFYLINLMLAVITECYEEEAQSSENQAKPSDLEKQRHKLANHPISDKDPNDDNHEKVGQVDGDGAAPTAEPQLLATGSEDKADEAGSEEMESESESESDENEVAETKKTLKEETSPKRNWTDTYNCYGCLCCCISYTTWVRFQTLLRKVVQAKWFEVIVTICIILTTLCMAVDHYQIPDWLNSTTDNLNYVFSAVFITEAILKILALTKAYFKNKWNLFDLFVVLATIVDISVQDINGLQVIRLFRLLRIFKLAQSWKTMRSLLAIITSSLAALGNLTIVLGIIIFVFALMGRELFRDDYRAFYLNATRSPPSEFNGLLPRFNFDDFFHSFMMIFRVLCGEWAQPLWECMLASGNTCFAVFMPALIFGRLMVLNLFLALLLNSFDSLEKKQEKEGPGLLQKIKMLLKKLCYRPCCRGAEVKPEALSNQTGSRSGSAASEKHKDASTMDEAAHKVSEPSQQNDEEEKNAAVIASEPKDAQEASDRRRSSAKLHKRNSHSREEEKEEKEDDEDENDKDIKPCFCSCCCMTMTETNSPNLRRFNTFRRAMKKLVDNKVFDGFILVCIAFSSIMLAVDDANIDNPENATLKQALDYLNVIFTAIFTLEMLIKWAGLGMKQYFSSGWCWLDFIIVVISLLSTILENLNTNANIGFLRVIRTFRALRPLRAISRWEGMKVVVNALAYAIPSIINVVIVCLVFWLIFAILGVQFFKGRFYKCVDANSNPIDAAIVPNKTVCLQNGYTWNNSRVNFDNVINGYMALFQVATFEGWIEVMTDAVNSRGSDDLQPYREASIYWYIYFVLFIVFGSFFTLNLFIGVIIDNFNVLKKKYEGGGIVEMLLTPSQRNYYATAKRMNARKPQNTIQRPKSWFLGFFFDVSCSNRFEVAVLVIILGNMIVSAIEHEGMSQVTCLVLYYTNIMFTTVFVFEAIVKLLGLREHYFRQAWNVFDFLVVAISITSIALDAMSPNGHCERRDEVSQIPINATLYRVMRVFRVGRVLRFVSAAKGIRKLLFALFISLPALMNIASLLFLVMFIYAIVGMSLFVNAPLVNGLDDQINFRTFINSIVLLFRLSTVSGWNDILDAIVYGQADCTSNQCPPAPLFISLYFVSYLIICSMMIVNMYIAILLENFNQAHQQEEIGITEDDFEAFYTAWEKYDPFASQFILLTHITDLVADLQPPLGIQKPNELAIVALDLPIVDGDRVHCLDVLHSLTRRALGEIDVTEGFAHIQKHINAAFIRQFPVRVQIRVISTTIRRKKEDVAARTLQKAWKQHKLKKRVIQLENSSRTQSRLAVTTPSLDLSKSQPNSPR